MAKKTRRQRAYDFQAALALQGARQWAESNHNHFDQKDKGSAKLWAAQDGETETASPEWRMPLDWQHAVSRQGKLEPLRDTQASLPWAWQLMEHRLRMEATKGGLAAVWQRY